jgi:hypothetical protein
VDLDASQWLNLLLAKQQRQSPDLRKWSAYYEGRQTLSYMDPELVREMNGRIRPVILNWPRLVVDSLEERLDVEGFRMGKDAAADERLWQWWQDNDLDEQSQQAHADALVEGRAFVIVGSGDEDGDSPIITVESAQQVTASFDPRTRDLRSAVKAWQDVEGDMTYATLYLPDATHYFSRKGAAGTPVYGTPNDEFSYTVAGANVGGNWTEYDRDQHNLGEVPVVALVNRPRTLLPEGISELADVVPLSDAACKVATDMMVAAEFHAMPRRWVVGMGPEDFLDTQGNPVSEWTRTAGRIWASEDPAAKMGQFPEANLTNFHETLNALAKLVASTAGLAPHVLGMATDNPASADAIRSSEARLVKRAERRQRAFGGSWEDVMRLAVQIYDGVSDATADMRSLEVIWRDASTPTIAQKADAAVKLNQAGITPKRQTREDLGYTQAQIARMEEDDAKSVDRILGGDMSSLVGPKPTQAVTPGMPMPAPMDAQPPTQPPA